MKNVAKLIGSTFLVAVLSGFPDYCMATKPTLPPFYAAIEPVGTPTIGEPTELRMRVVVRGEVECKDVNVSVAPVGGLTYTGEKSWTAHVTVHAPAAYILTVVIPPNDTSGLDVTINGGGFCLGFGAIYFVTTEDTVEVYAGRPTHKRGLYSQSATNDPIRDTLTEEQLQTEYEIWLDLRDSAHLKMAEKILGPLPDTTKVKDHEGYYILKLPFETILKLGEQGIELDRVKDKKTTRSTNDSFPKKQPQVDSPNGQTALPISPDGISLDSVDGSGTINTADLTYLVDCLFGSPLGPPPPPCQ